MVNWKLYKVRDSRLEYWMDINVYREYFFRLRNHMDKEKANEIWYNLLLKTEIGYIYG